MPCWQGPHSSTQQMGKDGCIVGKAEAGRGDATLKNSRLSIKVITPLCLAFIQFKRVRCKD